MIYKITSSNFVGISVRENNIR